VHDAETFEGFLYFAVEALSRAFSGELAVQERSLRRRSCDKQFIVKIVSLESRRIFSVLVSHFYLSIGEEACVLDFLQRLGVVKLLRTVHDMRGVGEITQNEPNIGQSAVIRAE
jgi:hypothetical protein